MGWVKKQPNGKWRACYRDPAGRERSRTFDRKGDAGRFLSQTEVDKERGSWRDPRSGAQTLRSWFEHYAAVVGPGRRPTTNARDRVVMETHFLPILGDHPLMAITPSDVRAVVAAMAGRLAPKTVRTNFGVLRAVLATAVEHDLLAATPCRGVRLPPDQRKEIVVLTMGELGRLRRALPERYRALAFVGGVLGLRWSEAAALRLRRIQFLRRTVEVAETVAEVDGILSFADVKTRSSRRTIAAPAFVIADLARHVALLDLHDPEDLIFSAPGGGPLRAGNFRNRVWRPAIAEAGLPGLTFHGLRHSAAGLMIQAGSHPLVIGQHMGHASIRTTLDVYGTLLPGVEEGVAAALQTLFESNEEATAG